jgi:hypothetical protein
VSKIKKIPCYYYETTDGRDDFINEADAIAWQEKLDTVKQIVKLDNFGQLTDSTDEAYFVRLNDDREVEAFASICRYEGYCAPPPTEPGDYYYQPVIREDQFISIKKIANYCKEVVKKLNAAEKVLPNILKNTEWYDGAVAAEQLKIEPEVEE